MSTAIAETAQGEVMPPDMSAYAQIIERAAANPNVDVDKLVRLIELQEQLIQRRAKAAFAEAMALAQNQIKQVKFNARNQQTRSNYATYTAIDREIRPHYTYAGFSMTFDTEPSEFPDQIIIACDVSHTGGFTRRYRLPMPTDGKGAKGGDVMTKTHATGAATSYGMRYLAKMIWNIAIIVDEDDVDGNVVEEFITESQAADLQALLEEAKFSKDRLFKYVSSKAKRQINQLGEIPATLYKEAVAAINKARAQGGAK